MLPVDSLVWHEVCENARLERLVAEIRVDRVREPVHVTSDACPVILDGAHRSRATDLLGEALVPAHVVPVPRDFLVPGWVHAFDEPPPIAGLGSEGIVIGFLTSRGVRRPVYSLGTSLSALFDSYWQVANSYAGRPYTRLDFVPEDRSSFEWRLPVWRVVREMTTTLGPLPAGVTRFGPLIAAQCPAC